MLNDAKSGAPAPRYTVDDALKAGRKRQKQRRALWATTGSAAAVLAVAGAVAVPQLIPSSSPTTTSAPPAAAPAVPKAPAFAYPKGDLTGNIKGYTAGGLTVSDTVYVTPGYQMAVIVGPGKGSTFIDADNVRHVEPNSVGNLTTYAKGVFDPVTAKKGRKVQDGWFTPSIMTEGSSNMPDYYTDASFSWEYATDSWAVVTVNGRQGPEAEQLAAVAKGLKGGVAAQPQTVGFKLNYLPKGYSLLEAGHADNMYLTPLDGQSSLILAKGDFAYKGLTEPLLDDYVTNGEPVPTVQLTVFPSWYSKHTGPADKAWCVPDNLCYRFVDGGQHYIEASGGGFVPDVELQKILDQATFADPSDESSWFTVS
ncbi:hypothetical protein [Actinoplanes sp. NPDC051494]|uniref:hypothetical protein n=1 Tax=Actinoplanes sp. NPDC051494 TaxID=3363907 RepID=UPI0037BDE04F